MPENWLTYRQLAEHWKTTPEAARARSRRGNRQRRKNNAGVAEVLVDMDAPVPEARQKPQGGQTRSATPPATPDAETPSTVTVEALEALQTHIATLQAQLAKAEAAVAQERGRADAERERVADLTVALLRITGQMMELQARPWWRRLAG